MGDCPGELVPGDSIAPGDTIPEAKPPPRAAANAEPIPIAGYLYMILACAYLPTVFTVGRGGYCPGHVPGQEVLRAPKFPGSWTWS